MPETEASFVQIGAALAAEFGLRGLFGVDCVIKGNVPYPVEINPRYTASVEVLEHATGVKALALHQQVFADNSDAGEVQSLAQRIVGKAILFAQDTIDVPSDGPWQASHDELATALREFADIPRTGERIERGMPIMTVFARAPDEAACLDDLRRKAQSLDRWLFDR